MTGMFIEKENSHNYRRGEGNGTGEGEKEGGRNILYLQSNTMCNQGGEKKEHSVQIMMDCVQTTN